MDKDDRGVMCPGGSVSGGVRVGERSGGWPAGGGINVSNHEFFFFAVISSNILF